MGTDRSSNRRRVAATLSVLSLVLIAAASVFAWRSRAIDIPLLGESSPEISVPLLDSRPPEAPYASKSFGLGFYPRSATELPVSALGGYCVGSKAKTLIRVERVEVQETETSVTLQPYLIDPGPIDGLCAGIGFGVYGTAQLAEPIGKRVVLNGKGRRIKPQVIVPSDHLPSDAKSCDPNATTGGREVHRLRVVEVSCAQALRFISTLRSGAQGFTCGAVEPPRPTAILCRRSHGEALGFGVPRAAG